MTPANRTTPTELRDLDAPALWTQLARTHLDTIATGAVPPRALISGTAGSGKSRLLRQLRRRLDEAGATAVVARRDTDIAAVATSDVLLIDDAHRLPERQLTALIERASDDEAALVVTARPWPRGGLLGELSALLERSQPAVVLGHISRSDLDAYLSSGRREPQPACTAAILAATGGIAWLVSESLALHASGCRDPRHPEIADALEDVIAHRLRASDPGVRALVERISLAPEGESADGDAMILAGYAEGLLLSNGRAAPVVRAAVRATLPVGRVLEALGDADLAADGDALTRMLAGVRDPRVAESLLHQGDELLESDPRRANELYQAALDSGADEVDVAVRRARAEWSLGEVDAAGVALDTVTIGADHPAHDVAADTASALWAARGLMQMSDAVYRSFSPGTAEGAANAAVAALGAADRDRVLAEVRRGVAGNAGDGAARVIPSTLSVATGLLADGLRDSLTGSADAALHQLVRSSEMYSASGSASPVPELPAVIAAIVALGVGEPDVAHSVLDQAISSHHGGAWAQPRLQLWRAWVALQREQAHDVEATLQQFAPTARDLSPRERLLFDALSVAVARRYHDTAALTAAWRNARESLLRARFDVFSQLLLGEFAITGVRIGEPERLRPHFARALSDLASLGSPPIWSAHLHWAGIQQGILLDSPEALTPHARALVDAAPHNPLAATMAQAGRVWTAVLSGTVDADAVENAATGLAERGLAWDGARLAGHGATIATDRRVIARLLACARRLHPHEEVRTAPIEVVAVPAAKARAHSQLSDRELEVATLVVQGKTYAEIGAAIFISPRTAEHHIARIRRRLGATTRSDLIGKLRIVLDEVAGAVEESHADGTRASA